MSSEYLDGVCLLVITSVSKGSLDLIPCVDKMLLKTCIHD